MNIETRENPRTQIPPGHLPMQTSGVAVTSMVLGILTYIIGGVFTAIPAVICGHVAKAEMRRNPNLGGRGMAIAGLAMGYLAIVITLVIVVFLAFLFWGVSEGMDDRERMRVEGLDIMAAPEAKCIVISPSGHDSTKPIPVAIWLHGYGSNPSELSIFREDYQKRADILGVTFVGISAPVKMDEGSYEWAEDVKTDFEYLESILIENADKVIPDWPRVAIFGFSQGGKVAGDIAMNYPEKFAGAILLSPGGSKSSPERPDSAVTGHEFQTYYCFVGADEAYGNVSLTERYARALERLGAKVTFKAYPGMEDHTTPPDYEKKLADWLEEIFRVEEAESL